MKFIMMIFCNIYSYSIFVNVRLIIWFLEIRFCECYHSCFFTLLFVLWKYFSYGLIKVQLINFTKWYVIAKLQNSAANQVIWNIFKNKVFLQLGSVRPSVRTDTGPFVNLGRLELTYPAQTFRDYSLLATLWIAK